MWRYTSQINYKVDESDQSPLTNSKTSLIKYLPNKLVPQIPSWSYSLYTQLGYAQAPDGIPVQSQTFHVVASIEVPVSDYKIVDLDLSYQFENSDMSSSDSENYDASKSLSKSKKLSDDELFSQIKVKLRENVKEKCAKDGIPWQDIENFELGYIKYLYERIRSKDIEEIIKEVSGLFKGNVHAVKRYLNDQFYEVQRISSLERSQKQQITDPTIRLQQQFMQAFFEANKQVVDLISGIEKLTPSAQLQKIQHYMSPEQYNALVLRMQDYIKTHQ